MNVLSIIATIFIPIPFVAGIYGMNFNYMPELEWKVGYFMVWGVMVLVVMVMVFYFKKKKWFKKNEGNEEIPDNRPVKQPREF